MLFSMFQQGGSPDAVSLKSGKSGKTQKSEDKKSKVSEKKAASPEKKEEFVVGKVFDINVKSSRCKKGQLVVIYKYIEKNISVCNEYDITDNNKGIYNIQ